MHDRPTTSWKRRSDTMRDEGDRATARGKIALVTGPVRILIADNDMHSADSLELMLHASGYSETRVAYSGHAALAIAAEFQPGVALLDLSLLDMTGYEVARSLREQAQSQNLRMIALTSSPEHAAREQARAAGFERYLMKPVAALDLSALLESAPE
jgi:CheY-like chemotaxis protein